MCIYICYIMFHLSSILIKMQHQRAMENLSELLFSLQTVEPAIPKYSDRVSMKLIE